MGATTADFSCPDWNNPIDTDLDRMRDNFNYLLCLCVAGSHVAPGWQTGVDISTGFSYAQPDAINLTKGTRAIAVNVIWE